MDNSSAFSFRNIYASNMVPLILFSCRDPDGKIKWNFGYLFLLRASLKSSFVVFFCFSLSFRISADLFSSLPRFWSRPKLSYDQTIQTEMTSDQTFQTEVTPDQTFQTKMISDQTFQTKMSSDQTETRPLSRLQCAYDQTQIQTIVQTINRLWSDSPDQSDRFSDQTQIFVQTIVRLWSDPNSDHCPDYKKTMIRFFFVFPILSWKLGARFSVVTEVYKKVLDTLSNFALKTRYFDVSK